MSALHELTVAELSTVLRTRAVSSVELTRAYLARIVQHQEGLNAFISVLHDEALAQAGRADARLAAGENGALIGVPIVHKDIFYSRTQNHVRLTHAGRLRVTLRC